MKQPKENVKNVMLLHSRAKVEFYKQYIKRYLRILCLSDKVDTIRIYDVFCGMGIYEDGGKGSPVVAYDAICECMQEERFASTNTQILLSVNDLNPGRVSIVRNYIDNHPSNRCKVDFYNEDVQDMFLIVKNQLKDFRPNTRNLIFIDPYGYKDIKGELLYSLIFNQKSEIILFLPISFMYRFIKHLDDFDSERYEALRQFTESLFTEEQISRIPYLRDDVEYVSLIKESLSFGGNAYSSSYTIQRDKSNMFALFFITSHIYGLEKINEVKWELDQENGAGFTLPEENTLFTSLFAQQDLNDAKKNHFNKLKTLLIEKIKEGNQTNRTIYKFVVENGYLPKHAGEVFKYLQKNDSNFAVFLHDENKLARKNSFYLSWKQSEEIARVDFVYKVKSK